jgi:hypothetical protein
MTAAVRFVIVTILGVLFSTSLATELHAQTRVALVVADSSSAAQDVSAHLVAGGFDVTILDAGASTPTLADLASYQVVFTWSNAPAGIAYVDASALGDVLASFVDSGRGVVQAGSSLMGGAPFGLDGTWTSGKYGAFASGSFMFAGSLTLAPVLTSHPILAGVADFHGGNAIAYNSVSLQGCAELVARWSNGRLLVAAGVGPGAGRVVGLNLYPVSDLVNPQYWRTETDGATLIANAVSYAASGGPHPVGPEVALVGADDAARLSEVRCKLHNLETFSTIDMIDAQVSTPELATLLGYDAVLTWAGSSYGDPAGMGDVLAGLVDANRGVVYSATTLSSVGGLGGRWVSGNYNPLIEVTPANEANLHLQPLVPEHAILSGVTDVDGGAGGYHTIVLLNSVAGETPTVIATWTNGQPMVVSKRKGMGGQIAALNLFPPSSDVVSDSWNRNTDAARLIANALMFVANHSPTVDAGSDLTLEATAAGVSVTLNADALDQDGDPLLVTWSGAVPTTVGSSLTFVASPPPPSQPSRTYTVDVTVSDGKGGEAHDVVNITIEDTDGPALSGVPADSTVTATSPDGAMFAYGPVTANDAVDGGVPATCSHSGLFPLGETVVTCSASDSRGNSTSASFIVTVQPDDGGNDPVTPGKVIGYGFILDEDIQYEFAFSAMERSSGRETASLFVIVKSGYCGRHHHSRRRNDRFVANTVDSIVFDDSSAVSFTGSGRWNGRDGYRYEVSAIDRIVSNHHSEAVHVTIKSPSGTVVAEVEGRLNGGNVRFLRMPR